MKSIMITGASSGIGRHTAEYFLTQGWNVGLFARRGAMLEEIAQGRKNAWCFVGDIRDEDQVNRAFQQFHHSCGHMDVLFNNAGVFTPATTIDQISLAQWEQAISVNLTGMFLAARAAFDIMRQQTPQGGRIINNGSVSAHVPREGALTYTVSKHGVTGLTRQLSLDGRPFDIACGQIDIGNAATDLLQDISDAAIARGERPPPVMDVADVARSVFHMASLPLEANVQFMTVMASKMPYIGRG